MRNSHHFDYLGMENKEIKTVKQSRLAYVRIGGFRLIADIYE